jgi:hypothetical protein
LREGHRLGVLKKKVVRRKFGHKMDELAKDKIKLHNGEPNDLYSSQNIVWVMKSRGMSWTDHVACMGRGDVYTEFWCGNLGWSSD